MCKHSPTVQGGCRPHYIRSVCLQDVSSTATVLMTVNGKALALQGGKQGKLYLLQQGNMGHMSPNDQNTYQTLDLGSGRDRWGLYLIA